MGNRRSADSSSSLHDPRYRFLARFGSVILSGGIAAVPRALYYYQAELGLLPQEVWFVGYILAHRWTAELPYPSLRKMARRTGVTYQMLHRYKNSLIAKQYLEVIPRTRANGGRTTNSYDFSRLFQALETLLRRDRGIMEESLEDGDPDLADLDPGQPELIAPDRLPLTAPGKPRLTAPDPLERTTRRDHSTKEQVPVKGRDTSHLLTTTTQSMDSPLSALLTLYADANGRPATPLQVEFLHSLIADLDRTAGAGTGIAWLKAAIHEASESGSGYLSPRRLARICQRWLADGPPAALIQSERRKGTGKPQELDWEELPAETWVRVRERLAMSLSPANFRAFVAPIRPLGWQDDLVELGVADDLTAQRLSGPFRSVVESAFAAVLERRIRIHCRIVRRTEIIVSG